LEKAQGLASSAAGGLAIMTVRGHGSRAMLAIEAQKLADAARIIREALGEE
jgi:hypothetical protein